MEALAKEGRLEGLRSVASGTADEGDGATVMGSSTLHGIEGAIVKALEDKVSPASLFSLARSLVCISFVFVSFLSHMYASAHALTRHV